MAQPLRHLLASADLTPGEIVRVLETARKLKRRPQPVLAGRDLALLFEKPSLRTRMSFEVGMRKLGGHTTYMAPQEVGIGEREAIKDVARAVSRYVDIVAVRTFGQENVEEYAHHSTIPVINALTEEEHPCQALADLLTLQEKWDDVAGRTIAFIGDGNNVAASLVVTAASLGMNVRIASPPGYMLPEHIVSETTARAAGRGATALFVTAPEDAARGADAVYTDVWTSMGQEAFVMHDLPAHRGDEITDEAMESPNSIVFDQAENRTWAQAGVVAMLLGVDEEVQA
jgi:ornithine carbamoyltransferase